MERDSAACALDWSIELERALRSKKPGRPVEAILNIGPRLEQWSRAPESNVVVYDMFGLLPGEDRLFVNTILLRLADAFRLGDISMKGAIVRVFLSELKQRRGRKCKRNKGLLLKARVANQLELLTRVKCVYENNDVWSKVLALVLFGCWAEIAKDNAQIQYLILSSLVSPNVLEVKASLFAAGCLCELSDDFASVLLQMLVNMLASSEMPLVGRLAGARVFSKLGCSYLVAIKSYKAGVQLVSGSSDEDFLVSMLFSLSKLASTSPFLVSEQVNLLLSLLDEERYLSIQATVLRCLHFLSTKGACFFPTQANLVKTLFGILDQPRFTSVMQCEVLQVLQKILLYLPSISSYVELQEYAKLFAVVENPSSPLLVKNHLAIRVLADLSCMNADATEIQCGVFCCSSLPSRVISLVVDHIIMLVKSLWEPCQTVSVLFQDLQSLLKLLLYIVEKHPYLGIFVLENVSLVVDYLVKMLRCATARDDAEMSNHGNALCDGENHRVTTSKFLYKLYRFLVNCLQNLKSAGAISTEVLRKVHLLIELVCRCSVFDPYTSTLYSLLLHSRRIWGCVVNENYKCCNVDNYSGMSVYNFFVKMETDTLECAQKMLTKAINWPAYRAGTFAAYHGSWFTSTFIFGKLIPKVQSDIACCWLKSLFQYASSEAKIQLLSAMQMSTLVEWMKNKQLLFLVSAWCKKDPGTAGSITEHTYSDELAEACRGVCISEGILEAAATSSLSFCFQRWFLSSRAKILEYVADLLKLLQSTANLDNNDQSFMVEHDVMLKNLKSLQRISLQLKALAREYDAMGASFIDMEAEGLKVISALALSCSVLAYVAGFAVSIIDRFGLESSVGQGSVKNIFLISIVQNLVGRLVHIDEKNRENLSVLLNFLGTLKSCFDWQSGYQTLNICCEDTEILNFSSHAISELVCLQNEVSQDNNGRIQTKLTKHGLQLLHTIIVKRWMPIPFRVPKYFFKFRQCIQSEIFIQNADNRSWNDLSVMPGLSLSLNLCLQLRNVPPSFKIEQAKLYCILYCKSSFQEHQPDGQEEGQKQPRYDAWESDDFVDMNEELLSCVANSNTSKMKGAKHGRDGDDMVARTFVRFFKPSDKGQGFSRCMLDVSGFPVGSYRMKWLCCCVDGKGSCWSILPVNMGPVITIKRISMG